MNDAETAVRNTAAGRDPKAAPGFIHSARTLAYNRLMGISEASAFRQPDSPQKKPKPIANKRNSFSAEGRVDLSAFNG